MPKTKFPVNESVLGFSESADYGPRGQNPSERIEVTYRDLLRCLIGDP